MKPVWNFLAPVNLATSPAVQVQSAIEVAAAFDAELTLIHVVEDRTSPPDPRLVWPQNALTGDGRLSCVHRRILHGEVAETITRYAELGGADLVWMATRNCGGWQRYWKRSVTAEVMASIRRPLWLADQRLVDAASKFNFRAILCLLSLDGTDGSVLSHAEELAQRSGGELILLNVVPEYSEPSLYEEIPRKPSRPLSRNLAVEGIHQFGEGLSVPYRTAVMIGTPERCVLRAARAYSADVVVTSSRYPVSAYRNRLNVRSVLRKLPCPLVVVEGVSPDLHFAKRDPVAVDSEYGTVTSFRM